VSDKNKKLGNVLCSSTSAPGAKWPPRLWRGDVEERRTKAAYRAAFSLIEVALALMVVSVGILSVLSLFPMGLDQNARAITDSHAGLFADEVMSGLRAYAETNWGGLNETVSFPVAAKGNFQGMPWTEFNGTNIDVNIYTNLGGDIVDHAFRFRLALASNGNIKVATLWVWGGEFGATSAPSIFYEEFFNYKPR